MTDINWNDYPNFSKAEFDCKHTGNNEMKPEFMALLQKLRTEYGKSMTITSGYRDPTHPIEARKAKPGTHASGLAADIGCDGRGAYELVLLAFKLGFTGIGVSQRTGVGRFVHLDILTDSPRPNMWGY